MDPNTPTPVAPQPEAPKSSKKTLLTLVSILVLLGIVSLTLFLFIQNKQNQTTGKKETSQKTAQQNKKESVVDKTIPKNYIPTTAAEKKMATNLQKYGVVCKRFTSLEEALKTPDIACVLDLSGKGLTSLSDNITKLTYLNTIDLSNNNFSVFPLQLLEIPSLQSIDLTNNKLTVTPNVSKLKNLQSLILTGNPITNKVAPTSIPVPSQTSSTTKIPQPTSKLQITY
ncbi:MAG: hypothetical protein COX79_05330 [Candidatus Levybacteria bacterium CG_4_10_14_0_2_um_filter_36_16]|nr:MAG: hypothetical protein COX79_05330 [Candidatus Levybacteria bacterium CG_4_10_14_0_2_um_filter_36_16]